MNSNHSLSYTARVPWYPTGRRMAPHRAAGLPVDVPGEPPLLALVYDQVGTPLGAPIAAYEAISEHDAVRDARGLLGIVADRDLPPEHGGRP